MQPESSADRYVSTVALSLFLFNLLPLPHTDGSSLLRSLLSLKRTSKLNLPSIPTLQATLSSSQNGKSSPSINLSRQYELNSDDEDEYDEERGHGGREGKREEAWKRRVRRGVEGGVMGVGMIWAAGWAMLSLLKST